MTVRPCLPWPDKRLTRIAEPVSEVTDEIISHWQDMIDTMEAMPGVGLAAPQIGVNLRLAVVDASTERGQAIRMANPEVLHASIKMNAHEEASPNLPGVYAKIERPRAVTVQFMAADGTVRTLGLTLEGIDRCIRLRAALRPAASTFLDSYQPTP